MQIVGRSRDTIISWEIEVYAEHKAAGRAAMASWQLCERREFEGFSTAFVRAMAFFSLSPGGPGESGGEPRALPTLRGLKARNRARAFGSRKTIAAEKAARQDSPTGYG